MIYRNSDTGALIRVCREDRADLMPPPWVAESPERDYETPVEAYTLSEGALAVDMATRAGVLSAREVAAEKTRVAERIRAISKQLRATVTFQGREFAATADVREYINSLLDSSPPGGWTVTWHTADRTEEVVFTTEDLRGLLAAIREAKLPVKQHEIAQLKLLAPATQLSDIPDPETGWPAP